MFSSQLGPMLMSTQPRELVGLKPMDRKMLSLYALGVDEADIAFLLGTTRNALRNRGVRIRRYTGTFGITDTVYWALDQDLIPPVPLWKPLDLSTSDRVTLGLISKGLTLAQVGRSLGYTAKGIQERLLRAMDRNGALSRHHMIAMLYSEDCYDPGELERMAGEGSFSLD